MKKVIHIYKLLLPYLWNNQQTKIAAIITLGLIGIDVLATTYFPYIWKSLTNTPIQDRTVSWFIGKTMLLFITWFLVRNSSNFREISIFPITNQAIKEIRLKAILKAHTVSLRNLEKYNVQEIISATGRISQSVRNFMRVSLISIFPSIAKIISLSVALLAADRLCGGIIVASYAGLLAASLCLRYYTKAKYKAWHLTDTVTAAMGQNLYNTATIRFNPGPYNNELTKLFNLEAKAWESFNMIFYFLHLIQDFIFYLGGGGVFCWLVWNYVQGTTSLDKLVLVNGLIAAMHGPLVEIVRNLTRFFGGIIDMHKTLDILDLPSENKTLQLADFKLQPIHLQGISFGYTPTKKLLDNLDLTIHPGDKIGILGPSGTGKSTLCYIIAGLIKPDTGKVLYGDLPIDQINPVSLGKVLAYIPQLQFIQELTLEQHVYGVNLKRQAYSGGEYQRHLLQKALQNNPQIIILDETVNALDEPTAKKILTEILQKVPTVIMVSHSQAILSNMERIFELKNGKLVEVTASS
jgi:ABC-type bacteriocin/lantibiotic exporter with double-glycine peptidase domain